MLSGVYKCLSNPEIELEILNDLEYMNKVNTEVFSWECL